MSFTDLMSFVNYAFVLFFGIIVSLYLADFPFEEHKRFYTLTLLGFGIAQIIFYLALGEKALYQCYPLLIHLPLILLIRFVLKQNIYVSMIAVLSAYLLCTPRKWIGTLVSSFFDYSPLVSNIVTSVITLPLLFLVIRYVAPHVIKLKQENKTTLLLFFLLPLIYYILEYAFTVYTDLLHTGGIVVIDFLDSFLVLLYFILSMLMIELSSQRNKAERENLLLTTVSSQAKKEIEQIAEVQKQAAIHRHDLRHHLNFLQTCLAENKPTEALRYIREIDSSLRFTGMKRYCVNDSINLILSSYADKAKDREVTCTFTITATDFSRFQITDLCSLISNGLDNAINACEKINSVEDRYIHLRLYEKNAQLCIKLSNSYSYDHAPVFRNEFPISNETGHGFGVQSMVSVIEKYQGICRFFTKNGEFCFQATL